MHLHTLPAESLAPIRARFLAALRDREPRLREAASTAAVSSPAALHDDVHKIRGVAPMLGLAELGALAADAETRLDAWLGATLSPVSHMPEDLRLCLQALHAAIDRALD